MIDIKIIREDPEEVKKRLSYKEFDASEDIDRILLLDKQRRETIAAVEADKAEQNKVSKQIPVMKKAGEDVAPVIARMNALKEDVRSAEARLKQIEDEYNELMLGLPNLPDPDLKPG
ncbi:MAG: serine--tRNA ligase, partial [Oscillospiraceae bacterium]|nr:serine--tRNA ligase [Oscillospiraceae bacterium]